MPRVPAQLLTVDRGNSTIDCFDHATGCRERVLVHGDAESLLARFLDSAKPARCVAVTVVADGLAQLATLLQDREVPLQVVGRDVHCPLPLDYETPGTLGADRWLGALAAHRRFGRAIVVDCGSATTVNLVDSDGTFRGGAIAPGLGALVAGLAATTPALPAPHLDAVPKLPARSSQAAVDVGVLLGYCGLVERLVADTCRVAAGPVQLVFTGGNASRLLRHTRLRGVHIDDLVHEGLAMLDGAGR